MSKLTVLIPGRNVERTLAETLDSLLAQTWQDFQVLLVDDASSDGTADIARAYSSRLRLEVLSLPENAGVAGALNAGLQQITTPYIARIDADDIALPTRLEHQVGFLEANPGIDVCSSWMEIFYEQPGRAPHVLAKPLNDALIKTALVQYCSMSHGASTFRKSFFDDIGLFNVRLDFAEDYDLWCRGALQGKCYANLPEALTRYRQHPGQVGTQKRQLQYERDLTIKRKYISALLGGESPGHLAEFFSLLSVFSSRDIALGVLEQSFPLLMRLGQRVLDQKSYGEMVSQCIRRHLG